MKIFVVWPFDDITTIYIVIGQFTRAGLIMVVGKTLTRSPWTTHKDYPKMVYAAEIWSLGLGTWVNQVLFRVIILGKLTSDLIHSVS